MSYPSDPELGWYYVVSVAGEVGGVQYEVGDWIVWNGTSWDKLVGNVNVIHDNVANEITAIALKATPVDTDELIIEDSNEGYVKKSITVESLPKSKLQLEAWPDGLIDMTLDGNWHDVDESGVYGAKKHLIILYIYLHDVESGSNVAIRPKGSSDVSMYYTHQVSNTAMQEVAVVQTDSAGVWQYKALSSLTSASYAVLGVITQ